MTLTMAKKKQASGKNKYSVLSLRPTDTLRAALKRLADKERRTLSKMAEILLERALQQEGCWPPTESTDLNG